jgi:SAM-dependent methyltransferase
MADSNNATTQQRNTPDIMTQYGNLLVAETFMREERMKYLLSLAGALSVQTSGRRALYLMSGGDFLTAFVLSRGADEIVLVDRLPFLGKALADDEREEHRRQYHHRKYSLNFSVEPDLLPEVGCLQYVLWELQAMGIIDIEAVRNSLQWNARAQRHEISYQLPGHDLRRIVYYRVDDVRDHPAYPSEFFACIAHGLDCVVRKAGVKITLDAGVARQIAASLRPGAVLYVDDDSRQMHQQIGEYCCPVNEVLLREARAMENLQGMLFGYHPCSVYQRREDRITWETQRRFQRGALPDWLVLPFPDIASSPGFTETLERLLKTTDLCVLARRGVTGLGALARRWPTRLSTALDDDLAGTLQAIAALPGKVHVVGMDTSRNSIAWPGNANYFVADDANSEYLNLQPGDILMLSLLQEATLDEHERFFRPDLRLIDQIQLSLHDEQPVAANARIPLAATEALVHRLQYGALKNIGRDVPSVLSALALAVTHMLSKSSRG